MHQRHRGTIGASPILCLASIHEAMQSLAVFERTLDGKIVEIG